MLSPVRRRVAPALLAVVGLVVPLAAGAPLLAGAAGAAGAATTSGEHAAARGWTKPARVSGPFDGSVVTPRLDVNRRGQGWAIWVVNVGGKYRLDVARRTPKGEWTDRSVLARPFPWQSRQRFTWGGQPDIAVDDGGTAVAVWAEPKTVPLGAGGIVRVRTATYRPGKGWSRPAWLSGPGDPSSFPDVEVSGRGHAVVQWAGSVTPTFATPTTLWTAYRRPDKGWEKPQRLDVDPAYVLDARADAPAIDDSGVATIAWDETSPGNFGVGRIRLATRSATGSWAIETLYQNVDRSDQPQVDATPDGGLLAVWKDRETILARHRAPDGVWGPQEQVLASAPGYAPNAFGIGQSETGLSAVYVQDVQLEGNLVQPTVLLQPAPGTAWVREAVREPYPAYFLSGFFPDFQVGPGGDVTLTWSEQDPAIDRWYDTYLTTRSPGGVWRAPLRVGKYAADPVLGSDRRGRVSVLYGEGQRYQGQESCCRHLFARVLTGG